MKGVLKIVSFTKKFILDKNIEKSLIYSLFNDNVYLLWIKQAWGILANGNEKLSLLVCSFFHLLGILSPERTLKDKLSQLFIFIKIYICIKNGRPEKTNIATEFLTYKEWSNTTWTKTILAG